MGSVTGALILLNVAVFGLQLAGGDALIAKFALWPLGRFRIADLDGTVGFHPWQLVTSAFLHGNVTHLFLNMFALYLFGRDVERSLGRGRYLGLYFAAVVTASLTQLAVTSMSDGDPYPTVGASGGVFGILLAFGVLFPRRIIVLLIPPIPMPARLFVILYGALELANGVFGMQEGVAHFAHLGGMLGAWLFLRGRKKR